MKYIADIKYYLAEDDVFQTKLRPPVMINTKFVSLETDGLMTIKRGWVWDGCSGPTIDEKWNQKGGCRHDIKYWLIRNGYLSIDWKSIIDDEFYDNLIYDIKIIIDKLNIEPTGKLKRLKVIWLKTKLKIKLKSLIARAKCYHWAVSKFGDSSVNSENKRPILKAP